MPDISGPTHLQPSSRPTSKAPRSGNSSRNPSRAPSPAPGGAPSILLTPAHSPFPSRSASPSEFDAQSNSLVPFPSTPSLEASLNTSNPNPNPTADSKDGYHGWDELISSGRPVASRQDTLTTINTEGTGTKRDKVRSWAEKWVPKKIRAQALWHALSSDRGPIALLVALCLFTDMVCYGTVVPIMPTHLEKTFGRSESEIALATAIYAIGLFVTTPFAAIASDRIGNRQIPMLLGLTLLIITNLLYITSHSYAQILVGRLLQGTSAAITWTVGLSLTVDTQDPRVLGSILGLQSACNFAGYAVGSSITGYMYEAFNPADPNLRTMYAPFIPGCVLAVLMWIFRFFLKDPKSWLEFTRARNERIHQVAMTEARDREDTRLADIKKKEDKDRKEQDDHEDVLRSAAMNDTDPGSLAPKSRPVVPTTPMFKAAPMYTAPPIESSREALITKATPAELLHFWKNMIRDGRLWLNALTVAVAMGALATLEPVFPSYLDHFFKATPGANGTVYSAITYPGILIPPIAGKLSDRYGPRLIIIVGLLLLIVSMPLLTLVPTSEDLKEGEMDTKVWIFVPIMILMGTAGFGIVVTPILPDLASCIQVYAPNVTAQAYAIFNMSWALGILWGPFLGAILERQVGFATMIHIINVFAQVVLLITVGRYIWEYRQRAGGRRGGLKASLGNVLKRRGAVSEDTVGEF